MSTAEAPRPRRLWPVFLPLIVFAGLVGLFLIRLATGDPQKIPSALIGQPAPAFTLPPLEGSGRPGLTDADLKGAVTLINVFASWCVPCLDEHPQIVELSKDSRIRVVGLNYKDQSDNARRFLGRNGNPYAAIGVDANGRVGIDFGVYGVPETFIIGRDGRIAYKFVGPIMPETLKATLLPEIEKALRR